MRDAINLFGEVSQVTLNLGDRLVELHQALAKGSGGIDEGLGVSLVGESFLNPSLISLLAELRVDIALVSLLGQLGGKAVKHGLMTVDDVLEGVDLGTEGVSLGSQGVDQGINPGDIAVMHILQGIDLLVEISDLTLEGLNELQSVSVGLLQSLFGLEEVGNLVALALDGSTLLLYFLLQRIKVFRIVFCTPGVQKRSTREGTYQSYSKKFFHKEIIFKN